MQVFLTSDVGFIKETPNETFFKAHRFFWGDFFDVCEIIFKAFISIFGAIMPYYIIGF